MMITSINPATGRTIRTYEAITADEASSRIVKAHQAWLTWKKTTSGTRSELLNGLAFVLRKRADELADLMASEMGKPVAQGLVEVEKCAQCCTYYAENASAHLADIPVGTEASESYVAFQPLGVVLAIMPWNFPFWQVFRFLAPALAAGNCGVLKHASNVPGCALIIEELVREAGFPENVMATLLAPSSLVPQLIEHPLVSAVTLTGSTKAGIQVAAKAASVLKKAVLELGGSYPYIVLADADLEEAAEICAGSRLINSGQSCIAAKRFIVERPVLERFTSLFIGRMQARRMGDPKDPATEIGPQARKDLRDELHDQVLRSLDKGAVCLLGGEVPPGDHAFYPTTVLTNVRPGCPAYSEELFGPVASIIAAEDEADAVRIANDTVFGLGSAVFTKDKVKGERIALQLEAGSAYVNTFVRSVPELPFGGVKTSGYGRELSEFGIREFVNVKTVFIK